MRPWARNPDDELIRGLERRATAGDDGAVAALDKALEESHGVEALAGRYAKALLERWRDAGGFSFTFRDSVALRTPDGASERAEGIELSAVRESDSDGTFVEIRAVLLPGLADEFYQPKIPMAREIFHDHPSGAYSEQIPPGDTRRDDRRINVFRIGQGRPTYMLGWDDAAFVSEAADAWLRVRWRVAAVAARRTTRRAEGLDSWPGVASKLDELAASGRREDKLDQEVVDLLRGAARPVPEWAEPGPQNSSGEGWSGWAAERLASVLRSRPFAWGSREMQLEVGAAPCRLWDDENKGIAFSYVTVLPRGVARTDQRRRSETITVRIAFPMAMGFRPEGEPPSAWDRRYPPDGRFEIALPRPYATRDPLRTNALAAHIRSVIEHAFFPGTVVEETEQLV